MFRTTTIATSTWALSAANYGFTHPITIVAFVMPWFLYQSYSAMITADDKTLESITPENTIILFDLHGVLFRSDYGSMIRQLVMSPHFGTLMLHLFNPFFVYDIFKLYRRGSITEHYFLYLTQKYDSLQPCLPLLFRIANQQVPSWKTIDIVQQLRMRGYSLHLFSNIGPHLFADLREQYPDVFELFDAIYVGSQENGFRGKPHPSMYYHYIITHPGHGKRRLLIDDRARNIAFARAFDIAGIRYRSPERLEKWLKAHGIL